jgi:tryptophanyl-tRNA synthetase
MKQRVFSGVQPTNNLHIGNYLGAIRNWVRMQDEFECIFCIVDMHALTTGPRPLDLKNNIRTTAAAYIASGIDPTKSVIFNQSQVSGHAELAWILNCLTPLGWLNRMTQFKDKAGKNRELAVAGLYTYPVLMAADILLYKAHRVPVGEDQKQHIEITRDIAGAFNRAYEQEYFPLPDWETFGNPIRVMSLRDGTKKMSKSDESDYSRILLNDDADTIALKIRKAKTDPDPIPATVEELAGRPEAENLIDMYGYFADMSPAEVCTQFAGANFSTFKPALADVMIAHLAPITKHYNELLKDVGHLDSIISTGVEHARGIASTTMAEIFEITGLLQAESNKTIKTTYARS